VVVAVLFNAGDQAPVIPLEEVVGNALKLLFVQMAATGAKAGVTGSVMVTERVAVLAHNPAVGVNV
jgi:hypothetical protein